MIVYIQIVYYTNPSFIVTHITTTPLEQFMSRFFKKLLGEDNQSAATPNQVDVQPASQAAHAPKTINTNDGYEQLKETLGMVEFKAQETMTALNNNESINSIDPKAYEVFWWARRLHQDVSVQAVRTYFASQKRLEVVLLKLINEENVIFFELTDPNFKVGADGFAVNADGSQHAGYRAPIFETGADGSHSFLGYKPCEQHMNLPTLIYVDEAGEKAVEELAHNIFYKANMRAITDNLITFTRYDKSTFTAEITVDMDGTLFKGLKATSSSKGIDGLTHTMHDLKEVAGWFDVPQVNDYDAKSSDPDFIRPLIILLQHKLKTDTTIFYDRLDSQPMNCLIER